MKQAVFIEHRLQCYIEMCWVRLLLLLGKLLGPFLVLFVGAKRSQDLYKWLLFGAVQ